jgi:hypothetical protein
MEQPEGLGALKKKSMTSAEVELATFPLVAYMMSRCPLMINSAP